MLIPITSLRLVTVAFRLDAFVRRVRSQRRPPLPPRGDQIVVVYRPHGPVHRLVLTRGEGRLLSLLAVGTPAGKAMATSVDQGWVPDAATADDRLRFWVGEGMFAEVRVRIPAPADEPR